MYERATKETAKWSFQIPPEPPKPEQIKKVLDCEAAVVGAGLGGLSAACRLRELGVDVLMIEKSGSYSGRGGHFGVPKSSLMEKCGIHNDLAEIARQWIVISGNNIDEKLLWVYLNRSCEAMDWFLPKAVESGIQPNLVNCRYPSAPYKEFWGPHFFKARGRFVSKALFEACEKVGVRAAFNTPARQLIQDETGRIIGLYAEDDEGWIRINASRGVVLATGDIGGDAEMLRAYAPDALRTQASQYVPAGCNTGDGHKMGLWAGAAMAEEVFPIMMHPQHYSWISLFYLYVNQDGERFMNEDTYVQGKATAFMRQPGGVAYSILAGDWAEHVEESLKYGGGIFWGNPGLLYGQEWSIDSSKKLVQSALDSGVAFLADTPAELAEKCGMPAETFRATLARYNENCHAGVDRDFGKRRELLYPLEQGPFIALKQGTALLSVVGGLSISTHMEVLNKDRRPIPGLYAVGDTTGGMYGHEYVTTILGNSHGRALTWGYLAAARIAGME